jgi:hypothetical protein
VQVNASDAYCLTLEPFDVLFHKKAIFEGDVKRLGMCTVGPAAPLALLPALPSKHAMITNFPSCHQQKMSTYITNLYSGSCCTTPAAASTPSTCAGSRVVTLMLRLLLLNCHAD